MELSNSCDDVTHGEGPLYLILTLSSPLPFLTQQQFSDSLQLQLLLNFSIIPRIPNQRTDTIIHSVDISTLSEWSDSRTVQLEIDRTAIPVEVMERIKSGRERFRAQMKLVLNEVTAAEWSPVCQSPIFQPCINSESETCTSADYTVEPEIIARRKLSP